MPSIPPATLPSNEVREKVPVPSSVGKKYPPAREPVIIPSVIIDFRDIAVTKIKSLATKDQRDFVEVLYHTMARQGEILKLYRGQE